MTAPETAHYRVIMYTVIAIVASFASLTGVNIWYTNHVTHQNNERWCDLLTKLDSAYVHNPPSTDTGRSIAAGIHSLRISFEC